MMATILPMIKSIRRMIAGANILPIIMSNGMATAIDFFVENFI